MKCINGLKRELVSRFGSMYTAWRQALDLDGNNRLSFGELCTALRHLGYGGNVKDLWLALDTDNDGFVMLHDLDPKTHEALTTYRKKVLEKRDPVTGKKKYANMLAVWRDSIDTSGSGQIDEDTFVQHCRDMDWTGDARFLFQSLKEGHARKFMTLRDYDMKAWDALNRGDMDMLSEERRELGNISRMGFQERQDSAFSQKWARMKAKTDRDNLERTQTEHKAKDLAAGCADSLRRLLVRKFGTMPSAW